MVLGYSVISGTSRLSGICFQRSSISQCLERRNKYKNLIPYLDECWNFLGKKDEKPILL